MKTTYFIWGIGPQTVSDNLGKGYTLAQAREKLQALVTEVPRYAVLAKDGKLGICKLVETYVPPQPAPTGIVPFED